MSWWLGYGVPENITCWAFRFSMTAVRTRIARTHRPIAVGKVRKLHGFGFQVGRLTPRFGVGAADAGTGK